MPTPSSDDVLYPKGRIRNDWFTEDLSADDSAVDTWISQGWEKASDVPKEATREEAAVAYAHYRAFEDIVHRMNYNPESLKINGEMSEEYSADQRQSFEEKADAWKDRFHAKLGNGALSEGGTRSTTANRRYP